MKFVCGSKLSAETFDKKVIAVPGNGYFFNIRITVYEVTANSPLYVRFGRGADQVEDNRYVEEVPQFQLSRSDKKSQQVLLDFQYFQSGLIFESITQEFTKYTKHFSKIIYTHKDEHVSLYIRAQETASAFVIVEAEWIPFHNSELKMIYDITGKSMTDDLQNNYMLLFDMYNVVAKVKTVIDSASDIQGFIYISFYDKDAEQKDDTVDGENLVDETFMGTNKMEVMQFDIDMPYGSKSIGLAVMEKMFAIRKRLDGNGFFRMGVRNLVGTLTTELKVIIEIQGLAHKPKREVLSDYYEGTDILNLNDLEVEP